MDTLEGMFLTSPDESKIKYLKEAAVDPQQVQFVKPFISVFEKISPTTTGHKSRDVLHLRQFPSDRRGQRWWNRGIGYFRSILIDRVLHDPVNIFRMVVKLVIAELTFYKKQDDRKAGDPDGKAEN